MIAATLHSPNYSPPNYDFDTIEVFPSLEEVIEALFERYSANGRDDCKAEYLDGHFSNLLYPAFEVGTYFTCYLLTDVDEGDEDAVEGRRLEAHTAVHGGWRDYTVTLDESDEGTLRVIVERAGI